MIYSYKDTIDPNLADNEGNTSLIHAAQSGQHECLLILLENFRTRNFWPANLQSYSRHPQLVWCCQWTDERNIKVDAVNALGFSALMKAAVQGHINCVSTLLEYGANDAIKDSGKGLCAQGWAQYCNRNQVVVQLSQFPREQVWRPYSR